MPESEPERICPRCGRPYNYLEVRHTKSGDYLYAHHYIRINGKRVARKCYLGPRNGYKYGTGAPFGAQLPRQREGFKSYLDRMRNAAWAAINTATTLEDIGRLALTLGEIERAVGRRLQLLAAAEEARRRTPPPQRGAAGPG